MTEELEKFRLELVKRGIQYTDASTPEIQGMRIDRIHFFYQDRHYSVIHGIGTYGGLNKYTRKDNGLLEVYGGKYDDPVGFLTADDVVKLIFDQDKQAYFNYGNEKLCFKCSNQDNNSNGMYCMVMSPKVVFVNGKCNCFIEDKK